MLSQASLCLLSWDMSVLKASPVAFLHIPKNAGSSIEVAAEKLGLHWGRWAAWKHLRQHVPAFTECLDYHIPIDALLRPNPYEGKEVFCVVRNPFDRLISQYSWLNSMHLSDLLLPKEKRIHDNQLPANQRPGTSANQRPGTPRSTRTSTRTM